MIMLRLNSSAHPSPCPPTSLPAVGGSHDIILEEAGISKEPAEIDVGHSSEFTVLPHGKKKAPYAH
ncbi:hypothetical protein P692DRAFT_20886927, partial [Suillus brevipes Sb2]